MVKVSPIVKNSDFDIRVKSVIINRILTIFSLAKSVKNRRSCYNKKYGSTNCYRVVWDKSISFELF